MRVRARLSSLAERSGTRPYQLTGDATYTFLAAAFTTNPLVVVDEDGAWLSATEIDAADDAEGANSFDVRDAALGVLARMNGAMELIAGEPHYRACDLASTSEWAGLRVTPGGWRISGLRGSTLGPKDIDAASVLSVFAQTSDPTVALVLRLATHQREDSDLFFDLWKAYEVLREDRTASGRGNTKTWAGNLDSARSFERFQDVLHSRTVSGDAARHANQQTPRHPGDPMSRDEAIAYVRMLVAEWLRERGVSLLVLV